MSYQDFQKAFNRAVFLSFSRKKFFFVFAMLALCGVLVVFFRGLAMASGSWVRLSVGFMPIFISSAVLLAGGVFMTRVYHDEIHKKKVSFRKILAGSFDVMVGAATYLIPIILAYLLLWMVMGVFILLSEIPGIGEYFGLILAFGPFLINAGSILLCVASFAFLFFVTPAISFRGLDRSRVSEAVVQRVMEDPFTSLVTAFLAFFPALFAAGMLYLSAVMTGKVMSFSKDPMHVLMQWFFIMVPFTAIMTPGVIFFYHFAAEAHVLSLKKEK